MSFLQLSLLFVTAILGGTLNSVAGGGSFFTFPSLIFTGVPPIQANATSTVALWPGSAASVSAYWNELKKQKASLVIILSIVSLIGGTAGAFLLLGTSQSTFVHLIPWLLLFATVLFTFSTPITALLRTGVKSGTSWRSLVGVSVLQLVISTYGGYFGGGIGILMLASLAIMGMDNIHEMNAVKTFLTIVINGVAVIIFVLKGVVFWQQAILMIAGAILGGYGGAYFARKIDQKWVRLFVTIVGFSLTIYFFIQQV
ncbi:MAG TPA: sulfite exporter TauE/SafE family protein [Ktedonobacteraceae bacterium]|jgi:hypothetical protein